jgi:hypothetical protein
MPVAPAGSCGRVDSVFANLCEAREASSLHYCTFQRCSQSNRSTILRVGDASTPGVVLAPKFRNTRCHLGSIPQFSPHEVFT